MKNYKPIYLRGKLLMEKTRKLICFSLFFLLFIQMANSQWLGPHTAISLPNQPSKGSLSGIMATNINTGVDLASGSAILGTARNFHHMEIDYEYSYFPRDGAPNINTCNTPPCGAAFCNALGCDQIMPGGDGFGFNSLKGWYCNWEEDGFGEMYAALESIFPKLDQIGNVNNPCSNVSIARGYPEKWYSLEEWGGIDNIKENAKNYAYNFAATFCPIDGNCQIDVLEAGNEPWGENYPGVLGYHLFLEGVIEGLDDYYGVNNWKMKLAPAAFEAFTTNPGCGLGDDLQYIEEMVPANLRDYFSYVSVHNYAFSGASTGSINCSAVTETPESSDGMFLTLKNMKKWQMANMPNAEVNLTEFGWNVSEGSNPVGEAGQNAYIMRSFLLANRYDIHKAFVYSYNDPEGECPLYCSTGLIGGGGPRKIVDAIKKVNDKPIGGENFLKALKEVDDPGAGKFAYLYGSGGKPSHLVVWKPATHSNLNTYPPVDNDYTRIDLPAGLQVDLNKKYYYLSWDNSMDDFISVNGLGVVDIQGLPSYSVNVKLSGMPMAIPLGANECYVDEEGEISNCGPCIDEDYDGYCLYEDCDDSDPSFPMPVGSTCDDGNPITENDQILGDGCTCQGIVPDFCGEDQISVLVIGNQVVVFGINPLSTNQIIKLSDSNGLVLGECNSFATGISCAPIQTFTKPTTPGTYNINIQLFFGEESPLNCNAVIEFNVPGECTDMDGDGTCEEYDCDDNDPSLPIMPGTMCDDNNPNTINDVIQGDGCECMGILTCDPPLPIGEPCNDGNPLTGPDVIIDDQCTCAGDCLETPGTPCDDGNPYTYPDVIQTDCSCFGDCNFSVGEPCDDDNDETENDMIDGNCNCVGTPVSDDPCEDVILVIDPENFLYVKDIANDFVQITLYNSNYQQLSQCDFYGNTCNVPNHSFGHRSPGTYHVFVNFYDECSIWLTITISAFKKPVVQFSKSPPPGLRIETREDEDGKLIIEIVKADFEVNLSPNPARDMLYLQASNNIKNVEVWSPLGEPLSKQTMEGGLKNCQIDLSEYTPGLYFCKTISTDDEVVVKAFVVQ